MAVSVSSKTRNALFNLDMENPPIEDDLSKKL
jgi:hypothetical protein